MSKCLYKNRDERYQTPADLIAGLRHLRKTMEGVIEATQRSIAATPAPPRK